jgi:hypothetical protein
VQSELAAKVFGDTEDPRRRLEQMFGGEADSAGPPPAARAWASQVLERADVDPAASELHAVLALRRAQPRLTLKAAVYLAQDAARA